MLGTAAVATKGETPQHVPRQVHAPASVVGADDDEA
jgi:hypothetical protein